MGIDRPSAWLLLSLLVAAAARPVAAQEPPPAPVPDPTRVPTVTVNATGLVEREPDRAILRLAVETAAPTAEEAVRRNATRMDAVLTALQRAGIARERLRTVAVGVHPEYARERPPEGQAPRIVGYRATNLVEATVDEVARLGRIIDLGVAAGADRVEGVQFGLRDPEAARLDAVGEAIRRGRAEAAAAAAALDADLGPALAVTSGAAAPIPVPMPFARTEALDLATPIEPGRVRVTANVTIVYRLDPR